MLDDIYSKQLIELAANISKIGKIKNPTASATVYSKLCGSEVTVYVVITDNIIMDFAHQVSACALGQASAAIMARNVVGCSIDEVLKICAIMRKMLRENGNPPQGKWQDLALFTSLRDYKPRHASILLTFDAIEQAIAKATALS